MGMNNILALIIHSHSPRAIRIKFNRRKLIPTNPHSPFIHHVLLLSGGGLGILKSGFQKRLQSPSPPTGPQVLGSVISHLFKSSGGCQDDIITNSSEQWGSGGPPPPRNFLETSMQSCLQSSKKRKLQPPSFDGKKITTPPPPTRPMIK